MLSLDLEGYIKLCEHLFIVNAKVKQSYSNVSCKVKCMKHSLRFQFVREQILHRYYNRMSLFVCKTSGYQSTSRTGAESRNVTAILYIDPYRTNKLSLTLLFIENKVKKLRFNDKIINNELYRVRFTASRGFWRATTLFRHILK